MEMFHHRFSELFNQLGLPNDTESIRKFIQHHSPLNSAIKLEDAKCWTPGQASLLKEALQQDADWAEVVDQLNIALRQS